MLRMERRIGIAMLWVGVLITGAACGLRSPFLNPKPSGGGDPKGGQQITVEVKPIVTSGFGNLERDRLGIDLSAYFTAFEVTIQNKTGHPIRVEGQQSILMDDHGRSYPVMTEQESLDYYDKGDPAQPSTVLIPKSAAIARQERERIRRLQLRPAEISIGESGRGVLLFQKVPPDSCNQVSLVVKGIRVGSEDQSREFRFSFSCAAS